MPFVSMLEGLLHDGCVVVAGVEPPTSAELEQAEALLAEYEAAYRDDCPGTPPAFSLPAATWAATSFINACRCLVYREIDDAGLKRLLSPLFPYERDASAHYSVDLTFRFLPDLFQRAKTASREDSLLQHLQTWAEEWPLSSVGLAAEIGNHAEPVMRHPTLLQMYVDRIIAREDLARMNDARVCHGVKQDVGLHDELAPRVLTAANQFLEESTIA